MGLEVSLGVGHSYVDRTVLRLPICPPASHHASGAQQRAVLCDREDLEQAKGAANETMLRDREVPEQ